MAENNTERIVNKAKSSASRRVRRKARRINGWTYFICFLALLLGFLCGAGAYSYVCRDDCFRLLGDAEYEIPLGATFEYDDSGVKIVEFGKNISESVKVESNMTRLENGKYTADTSAVGRYYIKYTVDSVKYGEICRIRVFAVGGEG